MKNRENHWDENRGNILIANLLVFILKIYRKYISPLKKTSSCIYTPTCSLYAIQALKKYGSIQGTYLATKRVLKCHPFRKGGYDPIP